MVETDVAVSNRATSRAWGSQEKKLDVRIRRNIDNILIGVICSLLDAIYVVLS